MNAEETTALAGLLEDYDAGKLLAPGFVQAVRAIVAIQQPPSATQEGGVVSDVVPSGWKFKREGVEAFVAGPNGGGWFGRKGNLWQRTLFDLVDALTDSGKVADHV